MAKKKHKDCGCIAKCNKAFADAGSNTTLDTRMVFNFTTGDIGREIMLVATSKADPKSRKPKRDLAITYCPICGTKVNP